MFWIIRLIWSFVRRWFKYLPNLWGSGIFTEFKEFLKIKEERKYEIEKIKAETSKVICQHNPISEDRVAEKIKIARKASKKVQEIEAETAKLKTKITLWVSVFLLFWLNLCVLLLIIFAPEHISPANVLELITCQMFACFGLLGYFKFKEKE